MRIKSKRVIAIIILSVMNIVLTFFLIRGIMYVNKTVGTFNEAGNKMLEVANNMANWKEDINGVTYQSAEETRRLIKEEVEINRGWIKGLERIEEIEVKK